MAVTSVLDGGDVGQFDGASDAQVAEVALGHGVLHVELALGEKLAYRLVENEAERTDISAHTRRVAHIEKLHVLVVVDPEIESFRAVIDLGADHLIRKIEV